MQAKREQESDARLQAEIRRGEDAERLLSEPLLKEAFETIEVQLLAFISALKVSEADMRDVYYRELGALASFKRRLELCVRTGNRAQRTIFQRLQDKVKKN
jgi:hypothetical protein